MDNETLNYKKELRKNLISKRKNINSEKKSTMDKLITTNLLNSQEYKNSELILVYISQKLEIDTREIIKRMWSDKKIVAVPLSNVDNFTMQFYIINSFDDTIIGSYNILEPKKDCKLLNMQEYENRKMLCVVPALCYDKMGYRLGFGKGYYDRFLSDFKGIKIGLCYSEDILHKLPTYDTDEKVDILMSEKGATKLQEEKS